MAIKYEVVEFEGRFYVQHRDESGEAWDADLEGFDTQAEAEAFLDEIQNDQP